MVTCRSPRFCLIFGRSCVTILLLSFMLAAEVLLIPMLIRMLIQVLMLKLRQILILGLVLILTLLLVRVRAHTDAGACVFVQINIRSHRTGSIWAGTLSERAAHARQCMYNKVTCVLDEKCPCCDNFAALAVETVGDQKTSKKDPSLGGPPTL